MDVFASADLFLRLAQAINTTGLTSQQITYRNHLIRINQQAHALVETIDVILNPTLLKIRHPNWQAQNVTAPQQNTVQSVGQPLLRPEALSNAKTIEGLAVRLTDMVLNKKITTVKDLQPLFNQLAGTFETLRSTYSISPVMQISDFSIPIRQIRDSLAWMHQFQQTAIREAGTSGTPTI